MGLFYQTFASNNVMNENDVNEFCEKVTIVVIVVQKHLRDEKIVHKP